jgi:hypothetical protein
VSAALTGKNDGILKIQMMVLIIIKLIYKNNHYYDSKVFSVSCGEAFSHFKFTTTEPRS